jgi:hypothetical protein
MPTTVLKMYKQGLRKEKEAMERAEKQKLLNARNQSIAAERSAQQDFESELSPKQKRQLKKLHKQKEPKDKELLTKISEAMHAPALLGFRALYEHLRRDAHCLLCPKLRLESVTTIPLFSEKRTENKRTNDDDNDDNDDKNQDNCADDFILGPKNVHNGLGFSHDERKDDRDNDNNSDQKGELFELEDGFLLCDQALLESGDVKLCVVCHEDTITKKDDTFYFSLAVKNSHQEQCVVLSLPSFYYPEGLPKSIIDEKIKAAIMRVFDDDDLMLKTMSEISNKMSVGQFEGAIKQKELLSENNRKHQLFIMQQKAKIEAVEREKSTKRWKRILHATAAAREKSQDIVTLAERDDAITRKELSGKSTHKSSKSWKGLHCKPSGFSDGSDTD